MLDKDQSINILNAVVPDMGYKIPADYLWCVFLHGQNELWF